MNNNKSAKSPPLCLSLKTSKTLATNVRACDTVTHHMVYIYILRFQTQGDFVRHRFFVDQIPRFV